MHSFKLNFFNLEPLLKSDEFWDSDSITSDSGVFMWIYIKDLLVLTVITVLTIDFFHNLPEVCSTCHFFLNQSDSH